MDDDFRMTLDIEGEREGRIDELLERFQAGRVEREAEAALGDRVVISHGAGRLFAYAANAADLHAAEAALRPLLDAHDLRAGAARYERWHPAAEDWEDAELPLPGSEAERAAEHGELREAERADSRRAGFAEWEVRVELPDRTAAAALAERLTTEGVVTVRRSHYVLAGAASEDDANALAERLRGEAPAGARFEVQGSPDMAWQLLGGYVVFGPPPV